jgi:hypothetical protein
MTAKIFVIAAILGLLTVFNSDELAAQDAPPTWDQFEREIIGPIPGPDPYDPIPSDRPEVIRVDWSWLSVFKNPKVMMSAALMFILFLYECGYVPLMKAMGGSLGNGGFDSGGELDE